MSANALHATVSDLRYFHISGAAQARLRTAHSFRHSRMEAKRKGNKSK